MAVPIGIPKNHYKLSDYDDHIFLKKLKVIYEIIVYSKKNLFMLRKGQEREDCINEIVWLLFTCAPNSDMKHITSKWWCQLHHTTETQLQLKSKGSFGSNLVKNGSIAIGDLLQLFRQTETIQNGIKDSTKPKSFFLLHISHFT